MITPEDETRYGLKPLPDVRWCGAATARMLRTDYEASRHQHRVVYPIIESTGPFVITPELEQERADRIRDQHWKEPTPAMTADDFEILRLKGAI